MIIYRSTKKGFQNDYHSGNVDLVVAEAYLNRLHRRFSKKEADSMWNSLGFMSSVLTDSDIPDTAGVAIEYHIPATNNRVDFILTGKDEYKKDHLVIIELKQWQTAELTEKDAQVKTALGKGIRETNHPSYQAWSYATLLENFNGTVQEESISMVPCAYLHNYEEDAVIRNAFYQTYLDKAPVFLKRDREKLREFIKTYVKDGDDHDILYRIDNGRIRPSKQLADSLGSMLAGTTEFVLIDEQKGVYENALWLQKKSMTEGKQVLIVDGGPGTGKSVVAINLLVEITKRGNLVQYVTRNSAPREVYQYKLTGQMTKTRIRSLFQGSGVFTDAKNGDLDALIVDEAHRLNEKSGMFQNKGENQVKEIIKAAKLSVFFIDERQKISFKDIGSKERIKHFAEKLKAEVFELKLFAQFRCNGSNAYLLFLDNLLQIESTAHTDLTEIEYDFKVCDSPNEMRELIYEKNKERNSARMLAGYCWDWRSDKDKSAMDIEFKDFGFKAQWNLKVDGMLWIVKPNSVKQIGCIHTAQGLEVDYIGVIIGPDFIVRNGSVITDGSKRSSRDSSIRGYKQMLKSAPAEAKRKADEIIKNTYRTLMTRGAKGCYVWSVDNETNEWLKSAAVRKSKEY